MGTRDAGRAIWILTINDGDNYGNRLQNYALQELLSGYARQVGTLRYGRRLEGRPLALAKDAARCVLRAIRAGSAAKRRMMRRRRQAFRRFDARYVHAGPYLTSRRSVAGLFANGDRFVIGSDQVWNDQWITAAMLAFRLGSYLPAGSVISYAASFGVEQVKDESKPVFARWLRRLGAIAVREDRGVDLVAQLAGREAQVVLDPTLMLPADRWRRIAGEAAPMDAGERYVLTYFLGRPSAAQQAVIERYAAEHGCTVRRILDADDPRTYAAGPAEFVGLFSRAQYVFTDSYHACCFSILFNTQFKVFNRAGLDGSASMNSRMRTLFRLFDLDDAMDDDTRLAVIDYEHVGALLERHRASSRAWLDAAMAAMATMGAADAASAPPAASVRAARPAGAEGAR